MSADIPPVSPQMAYGMAVLELQQQGMRDQDVLRDASFEVAEAQWGVNTIYRGLENAEKEIQREMAYVGVALWAVSTAISVGTFGVNAAQGNITDASIRAQVESQLMLDPTGKDNVKAPDTLGLIEKGAGNVVQLTTELSKQSEGLAQQMEKDQIESHDTILEFSNDVAANRTAERELTNKMIDVGGALRTVIC